jgi:hypothetical protein
MSRNSIICPICEKPTICVTVGKDRIGINCGHTIKKG